MKGLGTLGSRKRGSPTDGTQAWTRASPTRLPLQLDTPAPCTTRTSAAPSWVPTAGRRVRGTARSLASHIASSASLLLETRAFGIFSEM